MRFLRCCTTGPDPRTCSFSLSLSLARSHTLSLSFSLSLSLEVAISFFVPPSLSRCLHRALSLSPARSLKPARLRWQVREGRIRVRVVRRTLR